MASAWLKLDAIPSLKQWAPYHIIQRKWKSSGKVINVYVRIAVVVAMTVQYQILLMCSQPRSQGPLSTSRKYFNNKFTSLILACHTKRESVCSKPSLIPMKVILKWIAFLPDRIQQNSLHWWLYVKVRISWWKKGHRSNVYSCTLGICLASMEA